jgi:hypothetical protein
LLAEHALVDKALVSHRASGSLYPRHVVCSFLHIIFPIGLCTAEDIELSSVFETYIDIADSVGQDLISEAKMALSKLEFVRKLMDAMAGDTQPVSLSAEVDTSPHLLWELWVTYGGTQAGQFAHTASALRNFNEYREQSFRHIFNIFGIADRLRNHTEMVSRNAPTRISRSSSVTNSINLLEQGSDRLKNSPWRAIAERSSYEALEPNTARNKARD